MRNMKDIGILEIKLMRLVEIVEITHLGLDFEIGIDCELGEEPYVDCVFVQGSDDDISHIIDQKIMDRIEELAIQQFIIDREDDWAADQSDRGYND
jgi:hypothetical protein